MIFKISKYFDMLNFSFSSCVSSADKKDFYLSVVKQISQRKWLQTWKAHFPTNNVFQSIHSREFFWWFLWWLREIVANRTERFKNRKFISMRTKISDFLCFPSLVLHEKSFNSRRLFDDDFLLLARCPRKINEYLWDWKISLNVMVLFGCEGR